MITSRLALAAEESEEINPLIPHTAEIVISLIVFGLIFFLLKKLVIPMFEKAYADRTAAIEGGMRDAEEAQAEAKAALDKYNEQLSEARHEAARIREEAREHGAQIVAEMRAQAQAEAERISATAQAQIEAERLQTVQQLRTEIGGLATTLAGHIVEESLQDDDRQRRVVDRFIQGLEASSTGGRGR